jgi:hypothetical protein
LYVIDGQQSLIFDTRTWEQVGTIDGYAERFAPDGSLLVAKEGRGPRPWDFFLLEAGTWEELGEISFGDECMLRDAQFSSDGTTLAAQCWGSGLVVTVDINTGNVIEVQAADRQVRGIKFLSDSNLFVILEGGPGIVLTTDTQKLIQIARDRMVGNFTEEECEKYSIERCIPAPEIGG